MKHRYQLYYYDLWGNDEDGYHVGDVLPTNSYVSSETGVISAHRLSKWLGLNYPDRLEINDTAAEDVIYVDYDGKPYCELRRVQSD